MINDKNFFHPDFHCCYRSCTGSTRRFAEFTASREFHSAPKFYFMHLYHIPMAARCKDLFRPIAHPHICNHAALLV